MEGAIDHPQEGDLGNDDLAAAFERQGVIFDVRIPRGIREGMRLITPPRIVAAGLTGYTEGYLKQLLRRGLVPGYHIDGLWLLDAPGLVALREYEQLQLARQGRGARPGRRRGA